MLYGRFEVIDRWNQAEWEWEIRLCNARGHDLSATVRGDNKYVREASASKAMARFAKKLGIKKYWSQ